MKSILDPSFRYTKSVETDLRKTFARIRRDLRKQKEQQASARVESMRKVVPFHSTYGTLAIGLGAMSLDVLIAVTIAAYLKRRMRKDVWLWIHRLAYAAFALIFLHSVLSGTDFSDPAVSAITWGAAAGLLTLGLARLLGGRLPA